MSKFFILRLNRSALDEMFSGGQEALRIQISEGNIEIKSAMRVGIYKDAIAIDEGASVVNITGADAPQFAKAFLRQGFTTELPIFSLEKNPGRGGWYSLTHMDKSNLPRQAAVKITMPDNMDAVVTAGVKKVRKTKAVAKAKKVAKPAKTAKKTAAPTLAKTIPEIAAADAGDMMSRMEKMLMNASVMVQNAAAEKKAGRPRSELVTAQNTILLFEKMVHRFMGTTNLTSAKKLFADGLAMIASGLQIIQEIETRRDTLIQTGDFGESETAEIEQPGDEPVNEQSSDEQSVDEPAADVAQQEAVAETQEHEPEATVEHPETVGETAEEPVAVATETSNEAPALVSTLEDGGGQRKRGGARRVNIPAEREAA